MIKALVIDDVEIARKRIIRLLSVHPDVQVVGEVGDVRSFEMLVKQLNPDVVFLDISLQDGNGMTALERMGMPVPVVVITTAYPAYAHQAFRIDAADYLLKPIDEGSMAEALRRVRKRLSDLTPELDNRNIPQFNRRTLSFKTSEGIRFVGREQIEWLEAIRNYVALHGPSPSIIVRATFESVLDRLDDASFIRIHRSTAINSHFLVQLINVDGSKFVILKSGAKLKISRGFEKYLSQWSASLNG